jgi:hypothetical protein
MNPNAPPPQLVISPVFWPIARIRKKHWATSSISSAIASALLSTIGLTIVREAGLVRCRVGAIGSLPVALQLLQLTPWLSTDRMTPWLSKCEMRAQSALNGARSHPAAAAVPKTADPRVRAPDSFARRFST